MRKRRTVVELQYFAIGAVMIKDQLVTHLHCLVSSDISAEYFLQI